MYTHISVCVVRMSGWVPVAVIWVGFLLMCIVTYEIIYCGQRSCFCVLIQNSLLVQPSTPFVIYPWYDRRIRFLWSFLHVTSSQLFFRHLVFRLSVPVLLSRSSPSYPLCQVIQIATVTDFPPIFSFVKRRFIVLFSGHLQLSSRDRLTSSSFFFFEKKKPNKDPAHTSPQDVHVVRFTVVSAHPKVKAGARGRQTSYRSL